MERRGQEPTPRLDIERALGRIYEDQMLQFTATGYRLYGYAETGEANMHTIQSGESEHVFRVPVKEPVLQKEVASLDELFDNDDHHYDDGQIADSIDTTEYKEWVESLIGPQAITQAAHMEVSRRELEGDSETLPCSNCQGKLRFEHACSCTMGGTTFIDMTDDSEAVSLRENGVADPDCGTCGGSGKQQNDCPVCEGCGKQAKYPQIILNNELTGEERTLRLNLAALIAAGEVEVDWVGQEKVYANDYQVADKIIRFNVSDYIDRNLAQMGIDKKNSARVTQYGIAMLQSERANITANRAWWRKHEGKVETGPMHTVRGRNLKTEVPTPASILENAQKNLAATFAHPYGKMKNEQGIVVAEKWTIRPLRPIDETLADIRTFLEQHHYTLGFSHSFIATGEVGPSFYILDSDGNALHQLSCEYYMRESLENAWLALQTVIKQK